MGSRTKRGPIAHFGSDAVDVSRCHSKELRRFWGRFSEGLECGGSRSLACVELGYAADCAKRFWGKELRCGRAAYISTEMPLDVASMTPRPTLIDAMFSR